MASGWPLSESAARRQRRKRRRAEICAGRLCYGGPLGLGELPDPGWVWWGHQVAETQSHTHCQSFAQDATSLRDEFLEHVRQTFSEALKLVKAELVYEVGECQVGASATPGVDEVLLAAEEDAVGVVAVEGSAAVVRATVDPSTLVQVEEFDRFFTGDMVEVLGLQSARHLNGCRGCVVEILSDRFGVLLQGHAEPKALKGFNLRKVPMITKVQKIVEVPQVEFVDLETVYARESFARGSVCPRVAAAGNDEYAYSAVSAEVGRDLSLEVRGQPISVPGPQTSARSARMCRLCGGGRLGR